MIPEKLLEVLRHEGVVAIATQGLDGPHVVNNGTVMCDSRQGKGC